MIDAVLEPDSRVSSPSRTPASKQFDRNFLFGPPAIENIGFWCRQPWNLAIMGYGASQN